MYNQAHLPSMVFCNSYYRSYRLHDRTRIGNSQINYQYVHGVPSVLPRFTRIANMYPKIMLSSCDTRTIRIKDSFPMKIQHAKQISIMYKYMYVQICDENQTTQKFCKQNILPAYLPSRNNWKLKTRLDKPFYHSSTVTRSFFVQYPRCSTPNKATSQ